MGPRFTALIALPFDVGTRQVTGEATVIAGGVLRNAANGHSAFSASTEGTLVYASGQAFPPSALAWYDRAGNRTPTPLESASFRYIDLAPDASRAAAVIPGATGDGEIWIVDLTRGVRTRLNQSSGDNDRPVWSQGGDRLLYASQHLGTIGFFARSADGSGSEETVFSDDQDNILFDWSRDGRYVAYWPMGAGGGTPDVWIYSVEHQTTEPLIQGDPQYTVARFSPDGRWLSYVSDESGRQEIFVKALGGEAHHWCDDGREIVYLDPEQRMMAVAVEERDGKLQLGTPRELFTIDGTVVAGDAAGDHERFLVAIQDEVNSKPLHVILDWTAEASAP